MLNFSGNININIKEKNSINKVTNHIDVDSIIKKQKQEEISSSNINKCAKCGKKLKLTDIKCRCNNYYCSVHRYSDLHDCSFNYKTINKELLEKQNPCITAPKLEKI